MGCWSVFSNQTIQLTYTLSIKKNHQKASLELNI